MELLRYVHLNPVRPRDKNRPVPAERREAFSAYVWSSHRAYLGEASAPAVSWLSTDWLSFFAANRQEAQRRYRRFVDEAFGTVVECPWVSLRSGLVLGSEELLNRVRALLDGKGGEEEVRWMAREEDAEGRIALARDLAERQAERVWQVWVRVRLGAERRIDVARAYGYKDGSAITQILKRLEHDTKTKSEKQLRMSKLRKTFAGLSSVRS